MGGLAPAASTPGSGGGHPDEPADAAWAQLRSGLNDVLAELSMDGVQTLSGD